LKQSTSKCFVFGKWRTNNEGLKSGSFSGILTNPDRV